MHPQAPPVDKNALLQMIRAGETDRPELPNLDLSGTDLSGANLYGAGMRGTILRGAMLIGTDFTNAFAYQSSWRGAVATGAKMGARLMIADLRDCDFRGADFRLAELQGAWFHGSDLTDADMRRSKTSGAKYDHGTKWPSGFDPEERGLLLDESGGRNLRPATAHCIRRVEKLGDKNALAALGEFGDIAAVPFLICVLKSPDWRERNLAADCLGSIRDASAVPALILAAEDQDVEVRSSAIYALGQIGGPRGCEAVIAGLQSGVGGIISSAICALSAIGCAELPSALEPFVRNDGTFMSGVASRALERYARGERMYI
jgi:hypothetical protein